MAQKAQLILPEDPNRILPFTLPEKDNDNIRLITLAVLPTGEVGFCHTMITLDFFKQQTVDDEVMLSGTSKTLGRLIRNKLKENDATKQD